MSNHYTEFLLSFILKSTSQGIIRRWVCRWLIYHIDWELSIFGVIVIIMFLKTVPFNNNQ